MEPSATADFEIVHNGAVLPISMPDAKKLTLKEGSTFFLSRHTDQLLIALAETEAALYPSNTPENDKIDMVTATWCRTHWLLFGVPTADLGKVEAIIHRHGLRTFHLYERAGVFNLFPIATNAMRVVVPGAGGCVANAAGTPDRPTGG